MKSLGYITLAEAEKFSGIKSDTLKKRCQDGKIEGAIKQGNTWYVPQSEIIKSDQPTNRDSVLAILVTLAEGGMETGVTVIVSGHIITGTLVSKKKYFGSVREGLNKAIDLKTAPKEALGLFNQVFEALKVDKEKTMVEALDEPIHYLHLMPARIKKDGEWIDINNAGLRLKINSIDGFIWGNMD